MQKFSSVTFTSFYTRNGNTKIKITTTGKWVAIILLNNIVKHGSNINVKQMDFCLTLPNRYLLGVNSEKHSLKAITYNWTSNFQKQKTYESAMSSPVRMLLLLPT